MEGIEDSGGLGFDLPSLSQSPQMFSGFNAGGPAVPHSGGSGYQDESITGNIEENGDAKRRRIARACDMCRKKKIKCDGKMPKCSHCINYKTECVFTQVEKKRNPPKGAKYIEGLENRLGRMETLLKLSGLLSEEDVGKTDLGILERRLASRSAASESITQRKTSATMTSAGNPSTPSLQSTPQIDIISTPRTSGTSPDSPKEPEHEVEALSDMMCSLVTNNCGETRYIGSSSGFSIFSPRGIEWVNEKTGDTSFQDMISSAYIDDNKWMYWKPEIFSDIFARRVFKPLPPKEEAMSLFQDFFNNFNCLYPLFHEPTFMHLVERQYSRDPYEGSGWWASMNVVLAISHRLRIMSNLVPQEEDKKAWLYLKNAVAVLTELTMRNTDLLSVQALLGMALFLQGTPNPQPAFFLVAAAIRLSHSIGLHKRGSGFGLNPVEVEQRKRVFWIAYLLDKDMCLRSGRPPVQDDDDMNVELPSDDPADNIGNIPLADGSGKFNLFCVLCHFAIIQSKVYKRLYSTKAAKQSDGELLNTIGELDKELEEWKESIPLDYRPEYEIKSVHPPLIVHIAVLHYSYYNCLTTIHRMSVHHGYWTSRLSNYAIQGLNARPLNPRVFSSATLCVTAARASINLIKYIPQGDFACVWIILYFPVSALVTLFANILQNPQDARARSDIKMMDVVVSFLAMVVTDETNGSARRMLSVCAEFVRIAKVVLDKAEKESHSRRKRKSPQDSSFKDQQVNESAPQRSAQDSLQAARPDALSSTPTVSFNASEGGHGSSLNGLGIEGTSSSEASQPLQPAAMPRLPDTDIANMQAFSPTFPHMGSPTGLSQDAFSEQPVFPTATSEMPSITFQQPFVPQDLWQMPMTFEWDWAEMGGTTAFPSFENGDIFGGSMQS